MRLLPPSLGDRSRSAAAGAAADTVAVPPLCQPWAHEDPVASSATGLQVDTDGLRIFGRRREHASAHHVLVGRAPRVAVRLLSAGDEQRWDAYVETAPGATFFHLSGWKNVLEQAFGHLTFYMMAERDGVLT